MAVIYGDVGMNKISNTLLVFTIVESHNGNLTKEYHVCDDKISKTPGANMSVGIARRKNETLSDFAVSVANLKPNEAIILGSYSASLPEHVGLVTARESVKPKGNDLDPSCIARTKKFFKFVDDPGLGLIDYDPSPFAPRQLSPSELLDILTEVCPELRQAAYIIKSSVSATVRFKDAADNGGHGGVHIYLAIKQQSDYPRFINVLFKRLVIAGHGYAVISAAGTLLLRTYIDKTVASPERIIFEADPILRDGALTFTPASAEYFGGNLCY